MMDLKVTALRKSGAAHDRQIARTVLRKVALIFSLLTQACRTRRDIERLMSFDDYLLKDMGITRGEIEAVVRRGRAQVR
jgi:uncharacterized protein YjiS (DUF1127 family)